ncbi:MAG: aldehyde dehydrogenase family protein [Nitrospinaceae bacterium]|jgi:phenylacetaldehyde dehydrogenase|nr:aldehyde dehydrogenase family protein [Nitrospinaceae bacterium]MDP6657757.1 aldehyde dehydrogenase family protein [Nitrospinaceae bacterium]MDP7056784.1 aldehyde dehydrogenase family protein [Nitrospinaceae bacterium]|tara:strand:+ start:720 stop:2231 length:1512 start_codon:yes stop_codon:yes gene_type:complete
MSASTTPEPAKEVRDFLNQPQKMLINGKRVDAASGETFEVYDPSTNSVLTRVPKGGSEDIDRAVQAARTAFESGPWCKLTVSERGKMLWKLADLIEQHGEKFAQLETLDNGKPLAIARAADVPLTVDHFRYYAGLATKIHGETLDISVPYAPGASFFDFTLREPMGVVGQIIPWNFPLLMATWKLGVALAAGNCVVLKPAEQTPLSVLRLADLFAEAGFPDGVVNIVSGFPDTGAALSAHADVDKVAFTGSTEVGHEIVKASAGNLKRVSLELGGKSPTIVFPDADIDIAAAGVAGAIFFNHGQCCAAGSRLLVHKNIYEELIDRVSEQAKNIKVGPGMSPETEMGPLVSIEQQERVLNFIRSGESDGARIITGGNTPGGDMESGCYVNPTVFEKVQPDMKIVREEIFGPVLVAAPFDDVEEIIARGNDTPYGLAASVWTRDINKAHKVARGLKAGTVWVNCHNIFDANAPFGGYKMSGYGRDMSIHALENYTQVKNVIVQIH